MNATATYRIGDDCLARMQARRRKLALLHVFDHLLCAIGLGHAVRHTQALRVVSRGTR